MMRTQAACAEVGARTEVRAKAWHHAEWSSDEELAAQLHAEGKLFVIEMKIKERRGRGRGVCQGRGGRGSGVCSL